MNNCGILKCGCISFKFIFIFFHTVPLLAQSPSGWDAQENIYSNNVRTFDNRYEGVKGTPFLSEEWYEGELEMENGKVIKIEKINFDIFQNEVVIQNEKGDIIIPLKRYITSFKVQRASDGIRFFRKGEQGEFYEVLYSNGNIQLNKNYEKELLKADFKGAYSSNRTHDKFVTKESYNLYSGNISNEVPKLNKRNVKKLFDGSGFDVLNFMKKNDLEISEASVIRALRELTNSN